ncbi:thiol-activated cytolysin family protein [Sphingobacterium paludis]|uniref:Thiol-activated cytolysin n=1 Tax=Sphingobacterium paludis TaxID=1476465 RepID=A0A4R7CV13_9SPHI|nr:thiol-activated cytolysin family protein [Sphingobacterium paludis]TDS08880.1 thiol-activated cytolysin [Sphingobacterium paludis]
MLATKNVAFGLFFLKATMLLFLLQSCSQIDLDPTSFTEGLSQASVEDVTTYSSSEMTVMDHNYELVYLGSMLNGQQIINNGIFAPLTGYPKLPITVSTSIAGTLSKEIPVPRLSTFRQAVQDILRESSTAGTEVSSFLFFQRPFFDYNEIKKEFGYEVNTRSLFSTSNTSVINRLTVIEKTYDIVMGFELINFTIDMSLPRANELIALNSAEKLIAETTTPVYISSISYGQKGILAIESDYTTEETNKAFEKVTRKIFKKTTESLTEREIHIINNSTIQVYLVGGSNSGSVTRVEGYDSFINYIKDLGTFSAENPGFPISFRCRHLPDYSFFKFEY